MSDLGFPGKTRVLCRAQRLLYPLVQLLVQGEASMLLTLLLRDIVDARLKVSYVVAHVVAMIV